MMKFIAVYLFVMLFLSSIWFTLKNMAKTPEQRKNLLRSILFSGGLITVSGILLTVFVVLF